DLETVEEGDLVLVGLHLLRMARHELAHEVLGDLVTFLAFDEDFADILVIKITDAALDEVRLFIDAVRRDGFQRQLADIIPEPHEEFIVALDLDLGAGETGGADRSEEHTSELQSRENLVCR